MSPSHRTRGLGVVVLIALSASAQTITKGVAHAMSPAPSVSLCTAEPRCHQSNTKDLAAAIKSLPFDAGQVTRVLSDFQHDDARPLAQLVGLQELRLSVSDGTKAGLESLSTLTKLTKVQLRAVGGPSIAFVRAWTTLVELDIRSMPQVTSLPDLSPLRALQSLHLKGSAITSAQGLDGLSGLQKLHLFSHKQLVDISAISRLVTLRDLSLGDCFALREVRGLSTLTQLLKLSLKSTLVDTLTWASALTELTELDLWGTKILSLSPLAKLHKLQTLGLTYTKVKDLGPLHKLVALQVLYLDKRTVGPDEIARLKKALPSLRTP